MSEQPIKIVIAVKSGHVPEVISLGVPVDYYLLDFDSCLLDKDGDPQVNVEAYEAEMVLGTLSDTITRLKEQYL